MSEKRVRYERIKKKPGPIRLLGKTAITCGRACLHVLLVSLVIASLTAAPACAASKDAFPQKRITFIVPYSPGGGYDTYARMLSRVMPGYLPQKVNVIVRNITGAGGMTAMHTLFRSKPDGHTIAIMNLQGVALYQALGKSDLDPSRLSYLGAVARDPGSISVKIDSPYNSLADLQKAGTIKFGATGFPSGSYIAPVLGKEVLKINTEIVTGYRGSSGIMTGLIRGEVDATNMGVYAALPYVKAGETKVIIAYRENEIFPNVPVVEKGSPYADMRFLGEDRVVVAPPGVPGEILGILEKAFQKSILDPQTQAWSKKTDFLLQDNFTGKDVLKLSKELVEFYKKYKKALTF